MTTTLNEGTVPAAVPADDIRLEVLDALKSAAHYVERVAGTSPTQGPGIERQRAAARELKVIRAATAKLEAALATSAPPPVEPLTDEQLLEVFATLDGRCQQDAALIRMDAEGAPVDTLELLGARHGWRAFLRAARGVEAAHSIVAATHPKAPPPVEAREPKLVGYDECRCILTQYCDGQCRPIYEDADVVDRARMLYAEHPTYRGTTPLPWHYAPMVARKEWVAKAKTVLAATHPKEPTEARSMEGQRHG